MFTPGSILHGTFTLKAITKEKFSIVLYNDGFNCILTTFTTSEDRSGVSNPVHGKNPEKGAPLSYVFKKGIVIGELCVKGCKKTFLFQERYSYCSGLWRPIHDKRSIPRRSQGTYKML